MYREVTNDIEVEVTPNYMKDRSIPDQDHYFFSYTVTIGNHSNKSIRLMRRRIVVNTGKGVTREVEGSGVEGTQPIISPRMNFTYTSYCPLDTPTGNMRGSYLVENNEEEFRIKIPLVFFRISLDKWNQVS